MNPAAASRNQSITMPIRKEREREREKRSCKGVQFIDDRFVKSNIRIERVAALCRIAPLLQPLLHKSADIADVDTTDG